MRFQQEPLIMKDDQSGYVPIYYPNAAGHFAGASEITVGAGVEISGIDFHFARVHTVRVEGKVTNITSSRVAVSLRPADGSEGLDWALRRQQFADARGRFVFTGVMPGQYLLLAQSGTQENYTAGVSVISVGDKNTAGIVLPLGSLPSLTGTVVTEDLDTRALGLRVALQPIAPQQRMTFGGRPGEVQENGSFRIDWVGPGRYRVRVAGLPAEAYVKSVRLGQTEIADGVLDFTRGAGVGDLSITVSGKAGEIDGKALKKDAPAPGTTVVLIPDQRDSYNLYKTVVADMNGAFSIKGITPGNYKLFAWDSAEYNAWTDPDFLLPFEDQGQSIAVREGDRLTKDAQLIDMADKQ
jgi:hypothetical protein